MKSAQFGPNDSPSTGRRPAISRDVEKAVLFRIANGAYAPGERLPTCEQVGAELGVNKNTVSKAYRSLAALGYVRTAPGRGTFVLERPPRTEGGQPLAEVKGLLALTVQEAKLAGLDRLQFQELVDETVISYYSRASVRVGFVDCNRTDATVLSRDLQVALAHPVEPILLDDLRADPQPYALGYDVLAVNLTHMVTVEKALARAEIRGALEIVGLVVPPESASLTQIARLAVGVRLGVVCDLDSTMISLTGLIASYNPGLELTTCLSDDTRALRQLIDGVDMIAVTVSARDLVVAHAPRVPMIMIAFKVDEQSVRELSELVATRARDALRPEVMAGAEA